MATKHELANKKMQEMRLKNEEILKRFQVTLFGFIKNSCKILISQEVEQDKQKYKQQPKEFFINNNDKVSLFRSIT